MEKKRNPRAKWLRQSYHLFCCFTFILIFGTEKDKMINNDRDGSHDANMSPSDILHFIYY